MSELTTLQDFSDYVTQNEKLAFVLGFRKVIGSTTNGELDGAQWDYPEQYKELVSSIPVRSIPNFMKVLDYSLEQNKFYRSFPMEHQWQK